jgi:hypothetical protein
MPSAKDRFRAWKQGFRPTDISTPENRRRAETYTRWFDHGAFRNLWHNKSQFAPGARARATGMQRFMGGG